MDNELTNLLPPDRQRSLFRGYFLRLGAVAAMMVTALVCIAGVLLLPTYVILTQSSATKQTRLADIESSLASSNEAALSARLTALSSAASIVVALGDATSASAILRTALSISRPGVRLSGFSYTPAGKGVPGMLAISGIAATRDALRSYQMALQDDPFSSAANVPVSAYAKDADIPFTITVTLAP